MAEERARTGSNARTAGRERDPSLQWDGRSNRGTQRHGGHPRHLSVKIKKICVFEWE